MNERLRELMIEADYAAPELAGRAQKLAELIVKECVDVAGYYYTRNECVSPIQIKQHFGVE